MHIKTLITALSTAMLALSAQADGSIGSSTSTVDVNGGSLDAKGSLSVSISIKDMRAGLAQAGSIEIGNFLTSDKGSITGSTSKVKLDNVSMKAKGSIRIANFESGIY